MAPPSPMTAPPPLGRPSVSGPPPIGASPGRMSVSGPPPPMVRTYSQAQTTIPCVVRSNRLCLSTAQFNHLLIVPCSFFVCTLCLLLLASSAGWCSPSSERASDGACTSGSGSVTTIDHCSAAIAPLRLLLRSAASCSAPCTTVCVRDCICFVCCSF